MALGLPAIYTRVLTLRADVGALERFAYLAVYNVAYIVPLGLGLVAYALTLQRLALSERGGKALRYRSIGGSAGRSPRSSARTATRARRSNGWA